MYRHYYLHDIITTVLRSGIFFDIIKILKLTPDIIHTAVFNSF